jgi:hypothetical protein
MKRAAYIGQMFNGYAPKRPVGRPRKMVLSPIGLAAMKILVRKKRSNAGTKRGPRVSKKMLAANPFARLM